jgi:hypothetical protein
MQPRERQLRLTFDAATAHYQKPVGSLAHVLQQRGLADTGLPSQNQRPPLALADVRDQPVERRALV